MKSIGELNVKFNSQIIKNYENCENAIKEDVALLFLFFPFYERDKSIIAKAYR